MDAVLDVLARRHGGSALNSAAASARNNRMYGLAGGLARGGAASHTDCCAS